MMYEKLDALILERLGAHLGTHFIFLHAHVVRDEADRIAGLSGRESFRVLDGRLQKLRKSGLIAFNSKTGWTKTHESQCDRDTTGRIHGKSNGARSQ